ncbi:uncharacterized protein AAGF69_008211 isoform 2-T4 [Amazona ochrocephala]
MMTCFIHLGHVALDLIILISSLKHQLSEEIPVSPDQLKRTELLSVITMFFRPRMKLSSITLSPTLSSVAFQLHPDVWLDFSGAELNQPVTCPLLLPPGRILGCCHSSFKAKQSMAVHNLDLLYRLEVSQGCPQLLYHPPFKDIATKWSLHLNLSVNFQKRDPAHRSPHIFVKQMPCTL